MHKNATKCNKTQSKWCINKPGASKIIDTFETYQGPDWLLVEYKENRKYVREKFQNLKSHDCHVLMTQLLPVALRGILPENVCPAIVKVCAFLNAISQKVIDRQSLSGLQIDMV
jgi:hypothetical protein